jgi:hypothetical protein
MSTSGMDGGMDYFEGEDRRSNRSSSPSFPDLFLSGLGRMAVVVI